MSNYLNEVEEFQRRYLNEPQKPSEEYVKAHTKLFGGVVERMRLGEPRGGFSEEGIESIKGRLGELKKLAVAEGISSAAPLGISGYQQLQRLLQLTNYEVVREGKLDEETQQKVGTIHARIRPEGSLDILLEAELEDGGFRGWNLNPGYTYYRLDSLAEFTQFLEDYERLSNTTTKSIKQAIKYGIVGGLFGAGISAAGIAGNGINIIWLGFPVIAAGFGVLGGLRRQTDKKDYFARFQQYYQPRAVQWKTPALRAALELPPVMEAKDTSDQPILIEALPEKKGE